MRDRLACRNVDLITSDVVEYEIPNDMTYAYSFFGEIFRAVVDRIVTSIERNPRRVTIIFTVPKRISGVEATGPELEAYLEGTGRFQLRRRHRIALGRPNHSMAVYTSTPG